MTPRTRATLGGAGSVVLWCWSGVCFAVGARLAGPMAYLALMSATGALAVAGIHAVRGRPLRELLALRPRVAAAGLAGVAFYTVLFAGALGIADPRDLGQVNLLNYLWPVWIAVFSLLLLEEPARPLPTLAGALLGFAGVAVARGLGGLLTPPSSLLPHAMAGAGGVLWALYSVLLRRWRVPVEQDATAWNFGACALMAAAVAAGRGEWAAWPGWSPRLALWVLFGGVGPVGLAYHWWETGMKEGDVRLLGQLAYLTPIGSSLLIGVFFQEALGSGLAAGAALIVAGAALVRRAGVTRIRA